MPNMFVAKRKGMSVGVWRSEVGGPEFEASWRPLMFIVYINSALNGQKRRQMYSAHTLMANSWLYARIINVP